MLPAAPVHLLWLTLCTPAAAGTADRAEVDRLLNEMRALSARGAWDGVDRAWRAAMAVDPALVPAEAHVLGAHAAQNNGSMNGCWERLHRAHALSPTDETAEWIARIYANYGEVSLRATGGWKGLVLLDALDPTFSPDATHTLDAARQALLDARAYEGLLPLGRYRVGDEPFDIVGGPRVSVVLKKGEGPTALPADPEPAPVAHIEATPALASDWEIRPAAVLTTAEWRALAWQVRRELLGLTEVDKVDISGDSEEIVIIPTRPGLGRLRMSIESLGPVLAEKLQATQVTVLDGRITLLGAFGNDAQLRAIEVPASEGGRTGLLGDVALVERTPTPGQSLVVTAAPAADGTLLAEGVAGAVSHAGADLLSVVERPKDRSSIWGPIGPP